MLQQLLRKKSITAIQANHPQLPRILTAFDLTLLGIGGVIGAGVFVITGIAAATKAGPAVILSYFIAALAALFSALAYAELAASVGGTGSAYHYAYAGFGEFIAWLIGWNLMLEYAMAVAAVAIGWSQYVANLCQSLSIHLPHKWIDDPSDGGYANILAIAITFIIAFIQYKGLRQSTRFNAVMVSIKLLTIALFIFVALPHVNTQHWQPFLPFGVSGVINGAALVFFAYIGFDALSTAVLETIAPQRNVPIGIITSLTICSLIYIAVSAVLTGIISYKELNVGSPVAFALLHLGYNLYAGLIAIGAIAGLTSVMLVMFFGLPRICLAMALDGLFPRFMAYINPKTQTPSRAIWTLAVIISAMAGFSPIEKIAELVNIGTLTAFSCVCAGTLVLRKTQPHLKRPFKMPFSPVLPLLGVFACVYLMCALSWLTWCRFLLWTVLGISIYFLYGYKHSTLAND